MAYKALYRTFRPLTFEDVIGQEHITTTIKNQVQSGKIAHAYLFSGGRGSGKTSTAKILARAVNCLNPKNGEPCNECELCKAALEGTLTDISEIDAASNNGVDNIRNIREEVEYVPTASKYRVYIIDEVHMLSTGAFNALLKTLEEPPKHVIFILATTEPQKLPVTILSRCQRFDFRRISSENIIKRLRYICEQIGKTPEENALKIIAKMSDGAMRDAISLLDRCTLDGDDVITEEKIRELVGIPEFDYLYDMLLAILEKDANNILNMCEKIINSGKDLEYYTFELIKFIRDLVIFGITGDTMYVDDEKEKLKIITSKYDKKILLELITSLSEVLNNMKWALDKEIVFETGVLKFASSVSTSTNNAKESSSDESDNENDLKNKVLTNLKENRKMIMHAILSNATFEQKEDDLIYITFSKNIDDVNKQYMQKEESKILIKEVMKNAYGKDVRIKYVF